MNEAEKLRKRGESIARAEGLPVPNRSGQGVHIGSIVSGECGEGVFEKKTSFISRLLGRQSNPTGEGAGTTDTIPDARNRAVVGLQERLTDAKQKGRMGNGRIFQSEAILPVQLVDQHAAEARVSAEIDATRNALNHKRRPSEVDKVIIDTRIQAGNHRKHTPPSKSKLAQRAKEWMDLENNEEKVNTELENASIHDNLMRGY